MSPQLRELEQLEHRITDLEHRLRDHRRTFAAAVAELTERMTVLSRWHPQTRAPAPERTPR